MAKTESWQRLRRYWDKHAPGYDRQMGFMERKILGDHRDWACSQAAGDVLEVAIGTGLNLQHYPAGVHLTGIDWSPAMLAQARDRAQALSLAADLREGDAEALGFGDESFDTVVCTYSLCGIPNHRQAIGEMKRVLRPGGRLLLVDHVASTTWMLRAVQRLLEFVTVPLGGEHFTRRPADILEAEGFEIERDHRFRSGIVERLAARKLPASH